MALPTDDLIIWASSDVNLPNLAGPNKVKPIDDLILKGWDFKQKPAADEFNYVLNNLGMHVSYLEESKTYTFSGDVTGTATSTGSDDVTFNVSVTDNSHNHISANISDATNSNTANMIVKRDASGNFSAGTVTAALSGNSSTATTLQNSRTINGTSFNGSTNITTNSWGYSRNLAFTGFATGNGNVDGSGNVSISLSMGSGFTNSKTTNGYTYLPNGILLQWGYASSVGEDAVSTITLPVTFPNAAFSLSATPVSSSVGSGNTDFSAHGKILSTSQIALAITTASGTYPGAAGVYWLIIGD